MSYQDFQGFDQIEQELTAQNLIAVPPSPPPTPIGFSTGSGQLDPQNNILIDAKPLPPQQAIYDIFKATQYGAAPWNTHPAVRMVVEWIKKNLTDPNWQDDKLNSVIFSSIAPTPSQFTVGQIDGDRLKRGGVALLVKSIYNNCTSYDDNIQLDKCNDGIADLNSYMWDNKINFLVMWYRQNFNMWPTDNTTYVNAYRAVLCSSAYKTLKQMQAGSGTWLDANLEMFHHFVKLAACGANDDQINDIYQELTTVAPILDGSTFGEIYTNHWRSYEAWITKGYLDFGDLGATNLDKWHAYPVYFMGAQPEYSYLAKDVIQNYDYWKSAPSSSCFSASTRVLMASGETKAISDVTPGDRLLSCPSTAEDAMTSRVVAFVSKPKRAERRLYELESFPGIQFTETHPLLAASVHGKRAASLPILQFINRLLAASLNPTWQSFETISTEPRGMIIHEAPKDQGEELLYDLIFEPVAPKEGSASPEPLSAYIVIASNGNRLDALSEAPLIEWFPLEMIFVGNIIQAISTSDLSFANLIENIDSNKDSLQSLLRKLAGADVSRHSVNAIIDVTLDSLLLKNEHDEAQNASNLIEKLIMRLGRTIGKEIYTGWLNPSILSMSEADPVDVVFVHVLRRLSGDPKGDNNPIANMWTANIDTEGPSVPRTQLHGRNQGHNTLVLHEGIALPPLQQQAAMQPRQTTRSVQIQLMDHTGENIWVGGGPLQYASQSIISVGDLAAKGSGNHAVLEVELRTVPRERFEKRRDWEHEERAKYAATLGYAFGLELVRLPQGGKPQEQAK